MWASLVPLIIGSAILPMQIIVTIVLRRSRAGVWAAAAFVAGMTTLRLVQGFVLAVVIGSAQAEVTQLETGADPVVSTVLLMAGILLLAAGLRQWLTGEDPDAPPPRWLGLAESMRPQTAFGFGMLLVALGGKWWVFTLGAVAAISEADGGPARSAVDYLIFVALAELPVLLIVLSALIAPQRSGPALDALSSWMDAHNHRIVIAACLFFGLWFVVKAMVDFGVV
jgi:hypothetical protein